MRLTALRRSLSSFQHFHNEAMWSVDLKESVAQCCTVTPNFITEQEEATLLDEINPHMKRMRYEKSHWDDAIHLYREREQLRWNEKNEAVLNRMRQLFSSEYNSFVHILDLHADGVIKPHIDSARYCGDLIVGLCLLSDAVLRLRHKDRKNELILDLLVQRRCLYRLGGVGRYEFYHEVLGKEDSIFMGKLVPRSRRISIICRDLPHNIQEAQKYWSSANDTRQLLPNDDVK